MHCFKGMNLPLQKRWQSLSTNQGKCQRHFLVCLKGVCRVQWGFCWVFGSRSCAKISVFLETIRSFINFVFKKTSNLSPNYYIDSKTTTWKNVYRLIETIIWITSLMRIWSFIFLFLFWLVTLFHREQELWPLAPSLGKFVF